MTRLILPEGAIAFTIRGDPRSKKNSQRIVKCGNFYRILPSRAFENYQASAAADIGSLRGMNIASRVNVRCVYYMKTRRKVDLVNLLEATCDILVRYGVLADDSSGIVRSHDGSRAEHDSAAPRAEIEIREADR